MSASFLDAVNARHTFYQLANESTIPDSKIEEIIKEALIIVFPYVKLLGRTRLATGCCCASQ